MDEQRARKRVKEIKEFHSHAATYALMNVFFLVLNLVTSPEYLWALWPMMGWGIGLASHAAAVYGFPGLGSDWEERKVRELMTEQVTREEVERLLTESRAAERLPEGDTDSAERARLIRRIEHLEAIVTSRDWDLMEEDEEPRPSDPTERAARLSRRVR